MKVKVKFLRNGAPFNLAYIAGAITEIEKDRATELMKVGVVEIIAKPKKTTKKTFPTKIKRNAK